MNLQKRAKLNKILLIIAIVLLVLAIIGVIVYIIVKNNQEEEEYEDTVTARNYFVEITVDLNSKEVKRDGKETTLVEEFGITEDEETLYLNSEESLISYFADSTFEINVQDSIAYITNDYQTKKIIIQATTIGGSFNQDSIEDVEEIQEGVYILSFDTQKRTRDAYEYFLTLDWVESIEIDKVSNISTISDISQTVYGDDEDSDETALVYGVSAMGLDNFQNIINENGNPSDITIATIGYGADINNEYFSGRINENYYNYIENSTDVYETIAQGSRILEVIKESTTDNISILPLVVIDSENYTTTEAIIKALVFASQNSDVVLYEFINSQSDIIDLVLKNIFKEDIPICTITSNIEDDEEENYPANNSTTIAVSSIDKSETLATYSGTGDYLDFTAYSTDITEIFDTSSSVSKWSGASYSSAQIVAAIALIKTYHKDYTILEIYNELRNYCIDLGDEGKDEKYGYGCPNFSGITIADIDLITPEFQDIVYNEEDWEKEKTVQIIGSDNIRIYGWAITQSADTPTQWNEIEEVSPNIDVTETITENGTYYVWIIDSAGNTAMETIEINKIDNTPPTIDYAIDTSTIDTDNYVTISVIATDEESGLNESPYSWDNENWGTDTNELKVTENGRYTVYVRDTQENVSEKEIVVDVFDEEGEAQIDDGEIIKSIYVSSNWTGNTNNEVKITFKNSLKIVGYTVSKSTSVPSNFTNAVEETQEDDDEDEEETTNNTTTDSNTTDNTIANTTTDDEEINYKTNFSITTSLKADTKYYVWIKDNEENVYFQGFTISKADV